MKTEKRKNFIIDCMYFLIWGLAIFLLLKYAMPLLSPFVAAFVIAYVLRRPIRYICKKFNLPHKPVSVAVVLIFYVIVGAICTLAGTIIISEITDVIVTLPQVYAEDFAPSMIELFNWLEANFYSFDDSLFESLNVLETQMVQHLGNLVSKGSLITMGFLSGVATSLPGRFIKTVLMVIATFFISADYNRFRAFFLGQFTEKTAGIVMEIKNYLTNTLFTCVCSYGLIMFITFCELLAGFTLLGVKHAFVLSCLIAIFDILPVLGVGGILLPWALIAAVTGSFKLGLGLLMLYIFIVIVRNILEPKIVGGQLGLHPVLTLCSMFAGVQLFGVIGLFGFPILLSLLKHLNDNGTIHIIKESLPIK